VKISDLNRLKVELQFSSRSYNRLIKSEWDRGREREYRSDNELITWKIKRVKATRNLPLGWIGKEGKRDDGDGWEFYLYGKDK
jgi:hypothetical protein